VALLNFFVVFKSNFCWFLDFVFIYVRLHATGNFKDLHFSG